METSENPGRHSETVNSHPEVFCPLFSRFFMLLVSKQLFPFIT
jgi:hypothetical protein